MGAIGGAGHFWGNDKGIHFGGVREWMGEEELKKVILKKWAVGAGRKED